MPPKRIYLKEDIINAGMEIVRESGFGTISARNTAKRIKSSQIPIYSCFESIEELKKEVRKKFEDIMYGFMEKEYTENKILNAAVGVCIFAREEKKAFNELFLTDENIKENIKSFVNKVYDIFKDEERFKNIEHSILEEMLKDIWIYTHGLAVIINKGLIENITDEDITKRLFTVSQLIINDKIKRREKCLEK